VLEIERTIGNRKPERERLLHLETKFGGLTAQLVLDDAKDPASVLHKHFEWDDAKAATLQRLERAGGLIRSFHLIVRTSTDDRVNVRSFLHDRYASSGPAYRSIERISVATESKEQVLDRMLQDLEAYLRRYEKYVSIFFEVKTAQTAVKTALRILKQAIIKNKTS
jgi:hypothetical protein